MSFMKKQHKQFKKGRKKNSLQFMTLKSFKKDLKKFVLNEAKILKELQHRNIIKYYNWYETRNHFWVIYEYLGGTDLRQIVQEDGYIEEPLLRQITITILETLIYMHQKDVYFCDFKPSNFLLDEYSNLKLGDFLLAQMKQQIDFQSEIFSVDINYVAPEIEKSRSYIFQANQQTEVYGFGCLLYFLASGNTYKPSEQQVFVKGFSSKFNELLQGCLQKNPKQRFGFMQIVQTEWIGVLKDVQQHLRDMISMSKNFDQISDISEQMNIDFINNERKKSHIVRMQTDNFLDDISTMKNTQSESQLDRKNSMNKDNMSQKSVNYLDSSVQNKQSSQNLTEEFLQDFHVPQENFQQELKTIDEKLLFQKSEDVVESITMNDNIETVSLGSIEEIIKADEIDLQSEESVMKILVYLMKRYKDSEESYERTSILKFMIKLTSYNNFSNLLLQHQMFTVLMNDLSTTNSQSLRYYLCIVIGCIFRFTTTDCQITQIKNYESIFKELIEQENQQVSQKALGAFGEIMFYIYSQSKQNQSKISAKFLTSLSTSLKEKIDDKIYIRYVAKIIENCSSTQCGQVFATQSFIKNLLLCMKKNKDSVLNSFCLNIFKQLLDIDPSLVTFITTKDNLNFFLRQIIKENHKISKDAINLINKLFLLNKPKKLESMINKIGMQSLFQRIFENITTNYQQISSKLVLTISILISKSFHLLEYIITYTKILHQIDLKLYQNDQPNEYFVQCTQILFQVIAKILKYWFSNWQNQKSGENLNQQCGICCSYLHQLSELQFFIENYIDEKNLMEIFYFGETITTQIDANNYDILKSHYVQTLQNIIKSDKICTQYQSTFIYEIVPFLIESLQKEQIQSVLFMNFAIFIDIFNTFFSNNQIDNITPEMQKIIQKMMDLNIKLVDSYQDEEVPINSFRIISTLLSKQYIQNTSEEFNPKHFTLLIRDYIKDDYTKLNSNIYQIMIFIMQQNQSYIFKFQKYQLIEYAMQYVLYLNKNNYEHKVFYFFYTYFEIIHKGQKFQKLPKDFDLDVENIKKMMTKLYKDFFAKNVVEEDMVNIFYYCFQILQLYQVRTQKKITLDFHIDHKIVTKLKDIYSNDPILLKKVQKLLEMTSQIIQHKI